MNSGKSKNKRKVTNRPLDNQIIDASPGDGEPMLSNGQRADQRPNNVQETKAWKAGSSSIKRLWESYLNTLRSSFRNMNRAAQLELITKGSIVITIGVSVVSLGLFYYFLPTIVRVFALPLVLVTAWFVATKLVAPMVRERIEPILNDE